MEIIFLAFSLIFAFLIAYFIGRKRQIGFGWSLFFGISLSPLLSFIITILSRKYQEEDPNPSKVKKFIGFTLMTIFLMVTLAGIGSIFSGQANETMPTIISFGVGLTGAGYYLNEIGKGKSFNTNPVSGVED